jgi:hypothetical protein
MPLNRIYSTALWLLYVAGAPLVTLALALVTIPLLLTDVRAGIILLLLPGVLTLAPLIGVANPGNVPRDAYVPAAFLGMIRVLVPAIIWAAWYSYFEGDAREGTALLLVLIVSGATSVVLWAWSVDQFLTVAPYLDSSTPRPVIAHRVEIQPSLEREERMAMLAARERQGRIARAISATRPPHEPDQSGGVVTYPGEFDDLSTPSEPEPKVWSLSLFRRKRPAGARQPPPVPSGNGATPTTDNGRGDVFTGHRDRS